ncbi:MAG: TRAP-type C4-dicarboxylate transport system substrate-binding protein [Bacteriovoracaceae bacterium]|jgi:TRAP-type C4-dicarboxylate transport system substrate-binding protein
MKKLLIAGLLVSTFNAHALKIKIATIVPTGTSWAKTLKSMGKEIKKETKGKVKFQVYYGGVQGDEPDVLRKTRIGQLHGGVFTGKTLGDIFSDVRSIEVPFNFYNDEAKALSALTNNKDYFNAEIEKKGFINLGFYGIGKVYVVSTKKVSSIKEMKGLKMWAWEGDEVVRAMMDSLGLVSVPLALPDVMSSLSTGMIDAAYAPPLGILALQWQNKVKYLIDFPTAYSIGALLVNQKTWKKISVENQKIVKTIADKYVSEANKLAVIDNKKSLEMLKELGVEFVSFAKEDLAQAEVIRANVISKLKGKVLSGTMIKKMESMR